MAKKNLSLNSFNEQSQNDIQIVSQWVAQRQVMMNNCEQNIYKLENRFTNILLKELSENTKLIKKQKNWYKIISKNPKITLFHLLIW